MAEGNTEHNYSGLEEECDLYALYKIIKENGEEWVMMILDTSICDIPGAPPLPKEVKVHHLKHLLVHVPEILPSSLHLEYHDPSQLEDGDVLVIHSLWMWKTYAIVSSAKEKKVICFATRDRHPVSDMEALFTREDVRLREVGLDEVLDMERGVVEVVLQESQARTLRNARASLASNRPWSLFGYNSEHFVTHAVTGKAQSSQLNNLQSVTKKAVLSGVLAGLVTPESCAILRKCANCVATTTANKAVSSSAKTAAAEVAKQTVKGTAEEVAKQAVKETTEEVAKQAVKETAEEVAGTTAATATSRLANGAKAGLIVGAAVEGACLAYTGYSTYKKMENGEISQKEFRQHMVKRSAGAGGSMAGGAIGAAVGTAIIPVPFVGTFVGGVVGGVVGDTLGSKCGEKLDKCLFD